MYFKIKIILEISKISCLQCDNNSARTLQAFFYLPSQQLSKVEIITIPYFQMKKIRLQEINKFAFKSYN